MTRTLLALGLSTALSTAAAASPGKAPAQTMTPHHAPRPAIISLLPDAAPLAAKPLPYGGKPIDVLTYHNDGARTGWNSSETDLNPSSVASAKFGLLTTLKVDGNVFAQPLLVSGFTMPDGTMRDVLIVATGHDSVYAFDAKTYAVLWRASMGTPQATGDVGCGDVHPEYGISSTPVILRNAGTATIYLVAATEPSSYEFHTKLHALNLADGTDVTTPVELSPSATLSDGSTLGFDPQNQWNRAGLAAGNGSIYIGIGSHCDSNQNNISGWLLRYSPALAPLAAFHTIETPHGGSELASIWMTGFAPALDARGNLFVVTGNGAVNGHGKDWGESALSLTPALDRVRGHFTPSSYGNLNSNDQDFGSGGIMLLPQVAGQTAPPMAVTMGKSAVLYLLDQRKLGGLKPNDTGALQATQLVTPDHAGLWGGPAYYAGQNGPTVYAQANGDVLRAYSVGTSGSPVLTEAASGTTKAGYGGSLPIVSSSGSTPGTGVVWLVRRSAPIELEAYDADTLGTPLFAARAGGTWSNPDDNNPFVTPMVANGRVYAPGYKSVTVFGLTQ